MNRIIAPLLATLATFALAGAPAIAKDRKPRPQGVEATIPFAMSNIRDWQSDTDRALYIQDDRYQWYHATLMGPCTNLSFANRVGFDTGRGQNSIDKFSRIIVDGEYCQLNSLVTSAPPPPKHKKADKPH